MLRADLRVFPCGHSIGRPLHHGDAALVAGGVAAVLIQRPGGVCLVDAAAWIVREHPLTESRANAVALRHEQRLVVVAGEGGGHILLDKRTLAAALAAGAYLQRLGRICLHHEGLVVAPGAVGGADRGGRVQRPGVSGVLAMVLIDGSTRLHDAGRMSVHLGAERSRYTKGNIHAAPTLVVQADAACRSKASRRISGSSLPRAEALRRIPRQAFGLK